MRAADGAANRAAMQQMVNTVNAVQLGLGMCWDIFVSLGTTLFGVSFYMLGGWNRAFGTAGAAVALGALGLNFATFPMPPAESGLVDLGPGIAIWYVLAAWPMVAAARGTASSR